MPSAHVIVETKIGQSARARQLGAMFDVPPQKKARLEWNASLPIEEKQWNVGLIVGPSGSGKTQIAKHLWPKELAASLTWGAASVIDDFDAAQSMQNIAATCQAVGFNTIPAWLRPYAVLSNGEQFRVELARRVLELPDPVVVDEFSSVVDRQTAQIASHAVQKFVRRNDRQFIAVSCHHDIIDWLQPDWIYEPATNAMRWRSVRRRPELSIRIEQVRYDAWALFAPYHYLTAELNKAARCFALFVDDRIASFAGVLHRPHPKAKNIKGVSRLVTLPDWQGLGLAMVLVDALGEYYAGQKQRLRTYPAHPALIRAFDKSARWKMTKRPGTFEGLQGPNASRSITFLQRPYGTFEYVAAHARQ